MARVSGAGLTAGPDARWVTADGEQTVWGVLAVAQPDGRFELELHVIVAWPPDPLERLAADVRRGIAAAATRAGLASGLGDVQIYIEGVHGPDDAEVGEA